MGEGVACAALAHIVNTRAVTERVQAVVMLPGTRRPSEIVGKDKVHGLRQWYYEVRRRREAALTWQHSLVLCPKTHELVVDMDSKKRRYGRSACNFSELADRAVVDAGEADPLLVSTVAWPQIRAFLDNALRPQDEVMSDGTFSRD